MRLSGRWLAEVGEDGGPNRLKNLDENVVDCGTAGCSVVRQMQCSAVQCRTKAEQFQEAAGSAS